MFESPDFPKSLEESVFDSWLEKGRSSKIPYAYILIVWDELEANYFPVFVEGRSQLNDYESFGASSNRQTVVAAYDLYSESRMI
jgi:hypothetical protein